MSTKTAFSSASICPSCVLLCKPRHYCCVCLAHRHLVSDDDEPPRPMTICSTCRACVPDASNFVCPPCVVTDAEGKPFSYAPAGGDWTQDERAGSVLLLAACLSKASTEQAARHDAERLARKAVLARDGDAGSGLQHCGKAPAAQAEEDAASSMLLLSEDLQGGEESS